jgi:hypothetical protein
MRSFCFALMATSAMGCADDTEPSVEPWSIVRDEDCNPMSVDDDCLTPFPSLFQMSEDSSTATGMRLDYQEADFDSPDGPLPIDLSLFHAADGVSPVTPILVSLGVDVDPVFLSGWGEQGDTVVVGAPFGLLNVDTGERVPLLVEMDQNNRTISGYEGRNPLIIRPLAPMDFGARYLVVLTEEVTDVDGAALPQPDGFVALRDDILTDDSQVEALRPRYEELFAAADAAGWPRDSLHLAWELQVASEDWVLGAIRSMRDQTLADIEANGVTYTVDSVVLDQNENVGWMVKGTFQPTSFLTDDYTLVRNTDGSVVEQGNRASYPFTMVIPPIAATQGDLPLVLFGHGLFGTGDSMLDSADAEALVQPLAAQLGAVLIATDWIGLSGNDFDLILKEVLPDLSRVTLVTDRLVQSHVNNLALVELALGALPADAAIGVPNPESLIDPNKVYYYGISLGGVQGAGQVGISPRISRAVLAVPGSGWSHMIQRSTQFAELETLMDALYPDPLSQNVFMALLQGFFDLSDPANLGRLVAGDSSAPDNPAKVVVLQEAIGDCQVANIATELLARTMGASHLEFATDPVYGLETISGPTTSVALTQIRVPDDLAAYFPPDQNTLPELDNGVHNSAVLQEATFEQVALLFSTGLIFHTCDDTCEPD